MKLTCGDGGGPGAVPARSAGAAPGLPCLNGNKSIIEGQSRVGTAPSLTTMAAKTVFCLAREIEALSRDYPLDRIGFLTLTFADNITDRKEAWRRFRSLRTNVLRTRYVCCIAVSERQKRGAWHFHLIVVTKAFLGTARDAGLATLAQDMWREHRLWSDSSGRPMGRQESVRLRAMISPSLRAEWKFWREIAPEYGFGRCEILPVKSTAEAMGKYCGKYVVDHLRHRLPCDKGVRRVSYINFKGRRCFRPRFSWNSPGARRWRQAVAQFALDNFCRDTADLRKKFGRRWCYKFRGLLLGLTERRLSV
jgi:hypothetical protein